MHLRPGSAAYLENIWLWAADHDLDPKSEDQIDIYSGRSLVIKSDCAWLWATTVEHSVLYQFQVSDTKNIVIGMIQTESSYFQPTPKSPSPFKTGVFSNDPIFSQCEYDSAVGCAMSWGIRIVDSSAT